MSATVLSPLSGPSSPKGEGGAVKPNDQKKQVRTIVSNRLRLFFNRLKQQSASSTEQLWKRVEAKLNEKKR